MEGKNMRRSPTPEQKQAAHERRQRFHAMAKTIADMPEAQRNDLAARMLCLSTVEGRALSFHNTCMIAYQNPGATMVGGFRQWIKAGRAVRKGEHGLMIWVPIIPSEEAAEADPKTADDTRFIVGTVFDVAQTQETVGVA